MSDRFDYRPYIARALATEGGHLSIGRGGSTLYFENSRLSGCDDDGVKTQAIAAGLPVIDSRRVPFDAAAVLAVSGPMVAVNQAPSPRPWHGLAYAPLSFVATAYRRAGADVHNIADDTGVTTWFDEHPPGPLADILTFWLQHVRSAESFVRDRQLLALTLLAIRQLGEGRARVSREGQSCPSWHAGPQPLNAQAVRDLLADGWLRPVGGGEDEVRLDAWPSFADTELLGMTRLAARSPY